MNRAHFNQNNWTIYSHNATQEGQPIGTTAPVVAPPPTQTTTPQYNKVASVGVLYQGIQLASTTASGLRNEIDSMGNERFSRMIDDSQQMLQDGMWVGGMAALGGPKFAIATVGFRMANRGLQTYFDERETKRNIQDQEWERNLKGARANFNTFGGAYYD